MVSLFRQLVDEQVRASYELHKDDIEKNNDNIPSEFVRENPEEKISLGLKVERPKKKVKTSGVFDDDDDDDDDSDNDKATKKSSTSETKTGKLIANIKADKEIKKMNNLKIVDKIQEEDKKGIEKFKRKDYWLYEDIIVKVMNKKLGDGKFYKKKAKVLQVIDKYRGRIEFLESKTRVEIDQEELETVIPSPNHEVLILNGKGRGCVASLLELDEKNYCVKVKIEEGKYKGDIVSKVEYEDISKFVG